MGHGIMGKDIAPWKSYLPIYEGDTPDEDELNLLFETESYLDDLAARLEDGEDVESAGDITDPEHPILNGWRFEDASDLGKKKKCWAPEWRKGEFRVWLLNESNASNVGFYEMALCADDEASAQEFLKDFANLFTSPVKMVQDEIIIQWG